MELTIKPEDVDQIAKDAIMRSIIGKTISEAVAKALSGYDNPVDRVIKEVIHAFAVELIAAKYGEMIKVSVIAYMESKITKELVDRMVADASNKLLRAAQS